MYSMINGATAGPHATRSTWGTTGRGVGVQSRTQTQGRAGDEECGEDGIISFFLLPLNVPEAVKEGQKVTTDSSGILAIS